MFDSQDDPLGLGLKQRARDHSMSLWALDPGAGGPMAGGFQAPLGEDWDAFFQAVGEANPGKKVNFAGGTDPSAPVAPTADAGERFAAYSNQFRGYDPYRQGGSLTSLKKPRKAGQI